MRCLNDGHFRAEDNLLITLAACDHWIEPTDKILDFGCGAGDLVRSFRKKGFQAYGFDIKDYLSEGAQQHPEWFFIKENNKEDTVDFMIDKDFALPYPDNTFEVIVSTTTVEHLSNLSAVARELWRVTKPSGINLHVFPPQNCLIDGHTLVPLASYKPFQSFWWFYFMALCGIRNNFQKALSAKETAKTNQNYSKTGLFYRSNKEVVRIFSESFRIVGYRDQQYYSTNGIKFPFLKNHIKAFLGKNKLQDLAQAVKMKALFAVK